MSSFSIFQDYNIPRLDEYSSFATRMTFKVLIIGAGPTGLGLAHCLGNAKIDYLVLEQQKSISHTYDIPVPLGLWPHDVRILDQLGLLQQARKIDCNIKNKVNLLHNGFVLDKTNLTAAIGHRSVHFELNFPNHWQVRSCLTGLD